MVQDHSYLEVGDRRFFEALVSICQTVRHQIPGGTNFHINFSLTCGPDREEATNDWKSHVMDSVTSSYCGIKNVTPCNLVDGYRRFGGKCSMHHHFRSVQVEQMARLYKEAIRKMVT
jgi:hypothetical protein